MHVVYDLYAGVPMMQRRLKNHAHINEPKDSMLRELQKEIQSKLTYG